MGEFKQYMKSHLAEMRPYAVGEDMSNIGVAPDDAKKGSPKAGDMVARNPNNHKDQWLVEAQFFAENYIPA
jgi:hypothetical protein